MDCIHCGSEDTVVFFEEEIPCSHCDEKTLVVYEVCNKCTLMWKSVDGEVINNSYDVNMSLDTVIIDGELLEEMPTAEEIDKMIEEFENIAGSFDPKGPITMSDMVHKCLRCETVSYEIKPKFFHCPDCGFEWEVL